MINRRLVLLLALAGGLAAYVVSEGGLLPNVATQSATPPQGGAATAIEAPPKSRIIGNPLAPLDPAAVNEITARPLFNPTRAPAPAPAPEPVQVEAPKAEPEPEVAKINPDDFTLLAIATGVNGPTAVIRWNPTGEVFRLKRGQTMTGFQVAAIGNRELTVSRDGQSVELKLFQKPAQIPIPPPAHAGEEVDDDGEGSESPQNTLGRQFQLRQPRVQDSNAASGID